ncbi:Receptor-like protein kinase [Melia azedarach]|uniref:Receptor-like protein kinase n=1 Tax=Melia azedarach TaxID=155640 RepID=A0ACC1YLZ9_MELAZ|nr:Receptor-like protein kinase [Melia azedarach]
MGFPFLLLLSSFLMLPFSTVAQSNGSISVGASLSATQNSSSWLSSSGDFAFGFQPLEDNNNLFLLSIWYAKIPGKTIVWYANGDKPAASGSKVQLTADHGLVLTGPQGDEMWKSEPIIGTVARGVFNDTGNFVLFSSNSDKSWESFKNPTDTILPSQTLERGLFLSSRRSETNFSKGRFRFQLKTGGNLVLTTINLPTDQTNEPYYETKTGQEESNTSGYGSQVLFNQSGYMYLLLENDQRFPLTTSVDSSSSNFYYRATINSDGVFTQYQYPKSSSRDEGWTAYWSIPDNICKASFVSTGSGTCGFNSVCRLTSDRRPYCECPRGYSLMDPNDKYGSCKPNYTQSCADEDQSGSPEDLYDFEEITSTDWPTSDYDLLTPFTEDGCRQSCLHDCMCAVAIFRSGDMCWKKKLPLSNGRVDENLNGKALIKIRKGNLPPGGPEFPGTDGNNQKKNRSNFTLLESVLLGGSVFFNCIFVAALCLCFFLVYHKKQQNQIPNHDSVVETNLRCFTYKELEVATNGFKEELGKGAFGVVYKGAIQTGSACRVAVAVKRLYNVVYDAEKEFKTEVKVIGQTHHKNLVRLLGFCDDGDHKLLVYEFLSNGTLSSFLFGDLKPGWDQRTQVALAIARGLSYLHEECSTQIIHCDIKPQNILLDDCYNARISDFGLAKLLLLDQSQTNTAIRGTKGYVAPEWFRNLPITVKVDVYSFGVLLLEIICCRRNVDMEVDEAEALLTDWAYDCYCEGRIESLVLFDMEALNDKKKVEKFIMVAIWCIQEDPSLRPNMRKVTQMLEGVTEVPVPPCPCPFTVISSK